MKYAIIPGHNREEKGSKNLWANREYDVGSSMTFSLYYEHDVIEIKRSPARKYTEECLQVLDSCKLHGITNTLHLHFDAFNGQVNRCSVLVSRNASFLTMIKANEFIQKINKVFNIPKGQVMKRCKEEYGGRMLHLLHDNGIEAMILEPCFGDHKKSEYFFSVEGQLKYKEILLEMMEMK